jgi:transcriptional regulator with XRE-family HTH domain
MELTILLIDKAVQTCKSQAKLAAALHVSRQLVTDWKHGKAIPSELQVAQMAALTGVRIEDALLARSEDVLVKTEEGRRLVDQMHGGFLRGVVATFVLFATLPAVALCQMVVDTIYIVSRRGVLFVMERLVRAGHCFTTPMMAAHG